MNSYYPKKENNNKIITLIDIINKKELKKFFKDKYKEIYINKGDRKC